MVGKRNKSNATVRSIWLTLTNRFKVIRDQWLVDGEPSAFNYIHKLLNYGYIAGKLFKSRTRLRWSADGKRMYYDGRGMEITKWHSFIQEMVEEAEGIMSEHLLFRSDGAIPYVDLNEIVDNAGRSDAGYNYLREIPDVERNGIRRVLENLQKSDHWDRMLQNNGDSLDFVGVDEYERWVDKFLDLLCLLIITTCGQAGRVTEMTSLLYANTMQSDRGIYIEDGQFMLVTEYHKSQAISDSMKV